MRTLAGCVLLLGAGLAVAAEKEHPAEIAARATYAWVIGHAGIGLPDADTRIGLETLLTPELLALLASGRDTEQRCAKFTPEGDKPPLYEADVFVDTYEGAQEVALVQSTIDADTASIVARLFTVDENFPPAHRFRVITWQDTLQLRRSDAGWRVDDIAFQRGDTLRQRVGNFIEENNHCETAPQ